ncbi:MAG: hypothetical protein AAF744_10105 [Pseudomonadota bacterium]
MSETPLDADIDVAAEIHSGRGGAGLLAGVRAACRDVIVLRPSAGA